MKFNLIDPLRDGRWDELVAKHERASLFHERGWLESLARTYGYQPLVVTSSAPGRALDDGVVFCTVSSWITGTRLVSLPFSDHCDPLLGNGGTFDEFAEFLQSQRTQQKWRYAELRPLASMVAEGTEFRASGSYCFHELDLRPSLAEISDQLHRDSIRRKIRRAENDGVCYETGRTRQNIQELYRLLLITRRRHRLLPQPRAWFENLVNCLGDKIQIRIARLRGQAIGAMLTLLHSNTVVYKYGGSDARFHQSGAMPFLFWKLIEESKSAGVEKIDLGRSDWDQTGLLVFKDRLGAQRKTIRYYRLKWYQSDDRRRSGPGFGMLQSLVTVLPDFALSAAGQAVYRHLG